MKKILVLGLALAAALTFGTTSAASAAGSGDPTPYTVTVEGITLPAGDVFTDGSHINIKTSQGDKSIHFEKKYADPNDAEWRNRPFNPNDPRAQYYGQSFIPWAAIGVNQKTPYCVTWTQLHTNKGYNEHFGEGGQQPVGTGCAAPPKQSETRDVPTLDCKAKVVTTVTEGRDAVFTWKNGGWVLTDWTGWKTTGTSTRPATGEECPTTVTPIAPTTTPAQGICVSEEWQYKPATITLPAVAGGVWYGNTKSEGDELSGQTITLPEGASKFYFRAADAKYVLGNLPEGAVVQDGWVVFTVTPNAVQQTDCVLSETGGELAVWLIPAGALALLAGGFLLFARKRQTQS